MIFEHGKSLRDSRGGVNRKAAIARVCAYCRSDVQCSADVIGKDRFRSSTMPADPRRIGYIRVSTRAQMTDRQTKALEAECDALRVEHVSAVASERPVFEAVMRELVPGDTLVVLDLDRAFRSSIDAMLTADALRQRGVKMRILSLPVDTTTAEGELFYTMVAAFANFEGRIISRRTKEGLDAARRRGVVLGRKPRLTDAQIAEAHGKIAETATPCRQIAEGLGVSRITLQRGFRRLGLTYPLMQED